MRESMTNLMRRFPYFIDKRPESNFYRSELPFNEGEQRTYNDLFLAYISNRVNKRVWLYREQSEDFKYTMKFHIDFTDMEKIIDVDGPRETRKEALWSPEYPEGVNVRKVTVYKDGEVHYEEEYDYEDRIQYINSSFDDEAFYKVPVHKYLLRVETWEEYTVEEGFPQNDIDRGDAYDHDHSLDAAGAFIDVPRRVYEAVPEEWTDKTSPPYYPVLCVDRNGAITNPYEGEPQEDVLVHEYQDIQAPPGGRTVYKTEDDYHYMERLLNYALLYHTDKLPVLEVWKIFGLDLNEISLRSRKSQLTKMFEESKHPDPYWAPLPWEHKDIMCTQNRQNLFLFVIVDNYEPFLGEDVFFKFMIMDCAGNDVEGDWLIVPYLAGKRFGDDIIDDYKWVVSTDVMDKINPNIFNFKAFRTREEIEIDYVVSNGLYEEYENDVVSDDIIIRVRGCSDARWFVNHCIGDDSNSGESPEEPFKTIQKALDVCFDNDIIALMSPVFHLPDVLQVHTSCIIAYCGEGPEALLIPPDCEVFRVHNDFGRVTTDLTLVKIRMRNRCCEIFSNVNTFSNDNDRETSYNPLRIEILSPYFQEPALEPNSSRICRDIVEFDMNKIPSIHAGESITIEGNARWRKRKTKDWQPFPNCPLQVWINGELVDEIEADENGHYSWTREYDTWMDQTLRLQFVETPTLCRWNQIDTYRVYHLLKLMVENTGEVSYKTSNETLHLTLDEETSMLGFNLDDEVDHMDFWVNLKNADLLADWYYPAFDLEDEDTSIRGLFAPYEDGDTYFRVDYDDERIWYHKEDGCDPVPANEAKETATELLLDGESLVFNTEWPISLSYDEETGNFTLTEEEITFDPELQPNWEFETTA